MAMLYLTPVLPLGLVSYMCGTTSMSVYSFTVAKLASFPLYLLYTFMGASAHTFVQKGSTTADVVAGAGAEFSAEEEVKHLEGNEKIIIFGIVLSAFMMTLITRYIKKELMTVSSL
jgi:uncharacterized membrane protein YdjX (TVP38/TMEM64 family)